MEVSSRYILSEKRDVHNIVYSVLPVIICGGGQIFIYTCIYIKCLWKERLKLVVIVGRGNDRLKVWTGRAVLYNIQFSALVPLDFLTI